jgi:hypothetical protein
VSDSIRVASARRSAAAWVLRHSNPTDQTIESLKRLLLSLAAILAASATASAALVIDDSDISGGHYVYDLSFADLATPTTFNNDVFSQLNVAVGIAGSGAGERRFVRTTAGTSNTAEFIYKFDFTSTSFRPVSLSLTDIVFAFGTNMPSGVNLTATTAYSTDGTNYTTVDTLTATNPNNPSSSLSPVAINFAGTPDVVYYRTRFTVDSGNIGQDYGQWDRMGPSDDARFVADFTVVPEPSTAMLVLVAGAAALGFSRRRTS